MTIRNIRYYTAEGLLPPPDARGRYALYSEEHLDRLRLIQRLKEAFIPLPMMKAQIERLTSAQIAETESASDYIARVLGQRQNPPMPEPSVASHAPMAALSSMLSELPPAAQPGGIDTPAVMPEVWQRITLAPGVELHVRRMDEFVSKLIAYAQAIRPRS